MKVRDTQLSPLVRKGHRRAQVADCILQRLDCVSERGAAGHHADEPGAGLDRRTGLREPAAAGVRAAATSSRRRCSNSLAFVIGFSVDHLPAHQSRGNRRPNRWRSSKPLPTTLWIAYPVAVVLPRVVPVHLGAQRCVAAGCCGRSGIEPTGEGEPAHSEEELRLLVGARAKAGRRHRAGPGHRAERAGPAPARRARGHAAAAGNRRAGHRGQHRRVPGRGGEDALLPLPAVRGREPRQDAGRRSHQGPVCDAAQGAERRRTCCPRRAS